MFCLEKGQRDVRQKANGEFYIYIFGDNVFFVTILFIRKDFGFSATGLRNSKANINFYFGMTMLFFQIKLFEK